ncbi:MAG: DNA methyltransferase [Verrucomicrobiales bacterium]
MKYAAVIQTGSPSIKSFQDDLRKFQDFSRGTDTSTRRVGVHDVAIFENEFWTAKQRQGHRLHEVSYRACFKPQLPAFFIQRLCGPGDVVYDPFMGRGTTLIEARLHGCQVMGNDANPLSAVLVKPRLNPPTLPEIKDRLEQVSLAFQGETDSSLFVFFEDRTLTEIYAWREYFRSRQASGEFDHVDSWLRMVACNRLTGHSPGFFSVYTMPPNQAVSVKAQAKINQNRQQVPPYRDTKKIILRKSTQLLVNPLPSGFQDAEPLLLTGSADHSPEIVRDSVSLVVTSPPFLDTVDYLGDNWLRNWFCEIEVDRANLWQLRSLDLWVDRMGKTFEELRRILRPDGVIAFEVGEVRKKTLLLEDQIIMAGTSAGLKVDCVMLNTQNFTKTANCWGVENNSKGTNTNRIVVFRKG